MGKNLLTLGVGTVISQVFPLVFYPLLSRVYSPADFGLLATISSIVAVVTMISTLRYENAILIAKTKVDAANIVVLTLFFSVVISIIIFFGLLLFAGSLNELFKSKEISKWLWVVPISTVSIVIFSVYNEWCVRNKYFKFLSYNKITNSASVLLPKVFFGVQPILSSGLVIGDTLGRVVSAISCGYRALVNDRDFLSMLSRKRMSELAREFFDCPKFLLPAGLLDVLVLNMAVFMFSSFFALSEVGYYSMAMAVLSLPASVVSTAVKDVFRQRANEDYMNNGSCRPIFRKTVIYMSLAILPICLIFFFISPALFDIVLGSEWRMTGVYASILLPWIATDFVYSSISGVFLIANKMALSMWLFFLSFIASLLPLSIGCFYFQDIKISLILMVIFRILLNCYRMSLAYKYTQK